MRSDPFLPYPPVPLWGGEVAPAIPCEAGSGRITRQTYMAPPPHWTPSTQASETVRAGGDAVCDARCWCAVVLSRC